MRRLSFGVVARLVRQVWPIVSPHVPLIVVVGAYALVVPAILSAYGLLRFYRAPRWGVDVLSQLWGAGLLTWAFANRTLRQTMTLERFVSVAVVWLCAPALFASFSAAKQALWILAPYTWDSTLHAVDVWLHGGRAPWRWAAPLLVPEVIGVTAAGYWFWFLAQAIGVWHAAWSPSRTSRQFLLTYVSIWVVLGTVAAAALASGGPVYYGSLVKGPDPYAELWPLLDAHAPSVRASHSYLWTAAQSGEFSNGAGISAMPSVHVGVATALACLVWPTRLRWVGLSFLGLTAFGSVVLGWHYAIDAYAAIVGTLGLWCGTGALLARWEVNPEKLTPVTQGTQTFAKRRVA